MPSFSLRRASGSMYPARSGQTCYVSALARWRSGSRADRSAPLQQHSWNLSLGTRIRLNVCRPSPGVWRGIRPECVGLALPDLLRRAAFRQARRQRQFVAKTFSSRGVERSALHRTALNCFTLHSAAPTTDVEIIGLVDGARLQTLLVPQPLPPKHEPTHVKVARKRADRRTSWGYFRLRHCRPNRQDSPDRVSHGQ